MVVICLVASHTGIRGIVVVAVVAVNTVCAEVFPIKNPITVMDGEGGRVPARIGGVAHGTIRWDAQCSVVGVGTLVVIRLMATHAGIWCVVIVAVVAFCTIIYHEVSPIKNPIIVMNGECRRSPSRFGGVAGFTIRWQCQ